MSRGAPAHHRRVDITDTIDVDELMREIERYLAVVEAFRAEGCTVGPRAKAPKGDTNER